MSKSNINNYSNILILISGSVAAYKACQVISDLKKLGHVIKVVATPSAFNFIGQSTLEALSGNIVHSEIFEKEQAMAHIHLERWADLIVFCPATASSLNKMSAGIADDLVTSLYLSHEFNKPFLVFPAMNQAMWNHPTTKNSVERLRTFGIKVIDPDRGVLACGEEGAGRLMDTKDIVRIVTDASKFTSYNSDLGTTKSSADVNGVAKTKNKTHRTILITGGGTEERIDDVRVLTNVSTGSTAALIAESYALMGAKVTYLAARSARTPQGSIAVKRFQSYESLQNLISQELSQNHFDIIIHCAAVSDYRVSSIESKNGEIDTNEKKLSSDFSELTIHLKKNPKILKFISENSSGLNLGLKPAMNPTPNPSLNPSLNSMSNSTSKTILVAFKLTSGADKASINSAVAKLFEQPGVDFVLQNDFEHINEHTHHFSLFKKSNKNTPVVIGATKSDLVKSLIQEVEKHLVSIQNEEEWI